MRIKKRRGGRIAEEYRKEENRREVKRGVRGQGRRREEEEKNRGKQAGGKLSNRRARELKD